jgi:hypothetical protein
LSWAHLGSVIHHTSPTGRLTHPVTDRTASPKVARTLRELGIEIMTA